MNILIQLVAATALSVIAMFSLGSLSEPTKVRVHMPAFGVATEAVVVRTVSFKAPAKAIVYNYQTDVASGPMSVAEAEVEATRFGTAARVYLENTLDYEWLLEKMNPSTPPEERSIHRAPVSSKPQLAKH